MASFKHLSILNENDTVIQMAQCSFDVHVKECLGTLVLGASLVLLHVEGQIDVDYLSLTLQRHNVTFFSIVPSLMTVLCDYLMEIKQFGRLTSIRSFGFLGRNVQHMIFSVIAACFSSFFF
jgi:non-ribosomal peptide synthetase component F